MKKRLTVAKNPYISVIVPALNEAGNLRELVSRIDRALSAVATSYEIIIIDDRSTDRTKEVCVALSGSYPLRYALKKGAPGKAECIQEGLTYARGKVFSFIDGDLQYPPEKIPEMLTVIEDGFDVVIGEREEKEVSLARKIPSDVFKFLFLRLLHGLSYDVQSGLKVFKRECIEGIAFTSSGWTFDLEFLLRVREKGARVASVPIVFGKRHEGESKISLLAASFQIAKNAVEMKLQYKAPQQMVPDTITSRIGAGFLHKGKTFVSHTLLPAATSAIITFTTKQKAIFGTIILASVIGLFLSPITTVITILGILSAIYFIDTIFSLFLVYRSLRYNPELSFSDEELARITDEELPTYTILCPLYKESAVLPYFLKAIHELEYPKEKLDVLLLLEANDDETLDAAEKITMPSYVRTIIVPESQPKTKPKACNYGLEFAQGENVVIYDAEDIPDTQQLKKAYLGFKATPDNVVCLQAKLNYFNPKQNVLTRLFTAEYSLWFDVLLPGLQSINTYIPLGGTSNHFKANVLKELHGWDPFNVTEDCDLGVRLFSKHYRTAIIDSVTLEEANSRVGNWIRQRSRWIKGYMQTYLVYMRNPVSFFKENGIHAVLFQLVVGFKIIFGLINPFLWGTTIAYFTARATVGPVIEELYPPAIFILAVFSGIFGNFLFFYYYMIGCVKRGHWGITKYVYLMPFYWFITSIAAYLAFYQLLIKPHYWEKTTHGLHLKKTGLAEVFATVATVLERARSGLVRINPLRLPRYAFSVVGIAGRRYSTDGIQGNVDVGVIHPPKERHETVRTVLERLQQHLPVWLTTDTMMKSGVLVAGIMTANVLNLLFNMYLGRALSFETFGLVTFINTLWLVIMIFYNAVTNTMDHMSSVAFSKGEHGRASLFLFRMLRKVLRVSFVLILLWVAALPFVSDFFAITDIWALISFTPLLLFGIIDAVARGYIKGSLQFHLLALLMVLETGVKFLSGVFIVAAGFGESVYLAIPFGVTASALVALWILRTENGFTRETPLTQFPKQFYAASLLTGASALLFLSVDILFVKHYLTPAAAGEYALLSLTGKILFFLGVLPTSFMVTFISREHGQQKRDKAVFRMLFSTTVALVATGFLVLTFFGSTLIPAVFGPKATMIVSFIPVYVAAIALYTITNSIVTYHLAKKEYLFSMLSLALSGIIALGIMFNHESIGSIVTVIATTSVIGFIAVVLLHLFDARAGVLSQQLFNALRLPGSVIVAEHTAPAKKSILIFNWRDMKHVYAGGAEVYVREMAKRWVALGYDVTLFCGNDKRNLRYETIDGVSIIRRGGFYLVYFWAPIYYLLVLKKRFDIVVDCQNGIPFFTPLFRRGATYGLMHHVHQEVFTKSLPSVLAAVARFIEKRVMPIVYRNTPFITISESSKKEMQALGIGKQGITVVHPGVDLKALTPAAKAEDPLVCYVGRLKEYKSVDVLVNAFKEVLTQLPCAKLVIAGDGEEREALEKLVQQLGITRAVRFVGKIQEAEKRALLQKAWVAVNPSFMEGWGITTIEANACGTPVVASAVPGLKDSVRNPHTGFLVPYGSTKAFSEKIATLLTNKTIRTQMEANALAWSSQFDWDMASKKFLQTIDAKKRYA